MTKPSFESVFGKGTKQLLSLDDAQEAFQEHPKPNNFLARKDFIHDV